MAAKLYEIRWHGRGGQGAITAAKVLARAAFLQGYRGVTVAPAFGAERRGVPVSASTRISVNPIRLVSQVEKPNIVVILDSTLLTHEDITGGLVNGGWLIVNCAQHPEDLAVKVNVNIACADATRISRELGLMVGGLPMVNTAMLGTFVRVTEIVGMASIEETIRGAFRDDAVDINLAAIARTYEITRLKRTR